MNIRFFPNLFQALKDEANKQGCSIPVLVNQILMKHFNLER